MLLPLRGVATPGHGEGEGSAVDKFRVSGTQETVEGAGANEVSGVLSETSCCRCGAPLIKKREGVYKVEGLTVTFFFCITFAWCCHRRNSVRLRLTPAPPTISFVIAARYLVSCGPHPPSRARGWARPPHGSTMTLTAYKNIAITLKYNAIAIAYLINFS